MLFRNAALFLGLAGYAAAQSGPSPYSPIAGYYPLTDQTSSGTGQLEKDQVQKLIEDNIVTPPGKDGNEDCVGFANAEIILDGDASDGPLGGQGSYVRKIPTYIDSISDPYDEMLQYYGGSENPSSGSNFLQRWVKKAYQKRNFLSVTNRGSALFQDAFIPASDPAKDCIGFEEVLKKGLSYGAYLIESYQLMQKAIDEAEDGCIARDNSNFGGPAPCLDGVRAWDQAVAAYVGSLEGTDGNNQLSGDNGKAPYALADKRCRNYRICGPANGANYPQDGSDPKNIPSNINILILTLFSAGQNAAWAGDWELMKLYSRLISNKSAVPLIQGTFRYYYRFSDLEFGPNSFAVSDKELGEGAAFIMPILPKLWACSKKGEKLAVAQTRVDRRRNIQAGTGAPEPPAEGINFLAVQLAFECNYKCLGIKCAEVGELFDGRQPNGEPNEDPPVPPQPGPKPGFVGCDDVDNGSTDYCAKQSGSRKNVCKFYTGSPGVKDRNKLVFQI
jgi:hypothetical protein